MNEDTKKYLLTLVERMRRAAKNSMNSWDAGYVIDAAKVEDWADELEEFVKGK